MGQVLVCCRGCLPWGKFLYVVGGAYDGTGPCIL